MEDGCGYGSEAGIAADADADAASESVCSLVTGKSNKGTLVPIAI